MKLVSYEELRNAFLDVLDGNSRWYEIQYITGLGEERSKEIENIFDFLLERNNKEKEK
jgi:hypothetical protein